MRYLLAAPALLLASSVSAEPFNECPARAFLTQGKVPSTYSVNLVTGAYQVLASDMGTTSSVNGLGFNTNDMYIYGWSYEHQKPVRVHDEFKIEVMDTENISGTNFYVGDVSTVDNKYYVYRRGATGGLFSIGLDPAKDDYQKMVKIVNGTQLSLSIADMAFHPNTAAAYAVEFDGDLHEIDVYNGSSVKLGNIGQTGGFGAAYFDPNGNLYLSRNNDGAIFRVSIDKAEYEGVFFAKGPASSTNDGSRCAQAPIIDASNTYLDFGDAPDSYGTLLDSNGARHGLSDNNTVYLGNYVDGESDASMAPLSDDENGAELDDDGVQFATTLKEDNNAIVKVNASTSGYLNGWIDIDQNGQFDGNDQVVQDVKLNAGTQYVYMKIPAGVKGGESWARFRFSSSNGVRAVGGAPDGEVEDYKVELVESDATVTHYPSANGWTSLAYEDNWPYEGDYDMNDLIVRMRTSFWNRSSGVTQVNLKGEVVAVGAAYHNGFAVRLPGVKRELVDEENIEFLINDKAATFNPLESDRDEAIFIVAYNLMDYIGSGEHCKFFRTEPGCGSDIQMKFSARIPMIEPVDVQLKGAMDPFLFATPGAWHGGHFATAPGRSYEIHMKNIAPTEAFDSGLFNNTGDDNSNPDQGYYFQTAKGMPWAMEIGTDWKYPKEYMDIGHAYPYFADWTRSDGWDNRDWYMSSNAYSPMLFED